MGSGTPTVQDLLQHLSLHVQENKPVTYKWLAREYSLPSNYAKQLLFRYVQEHGSSVSAVYAVSGLLKAPQGGLQHVLRLVPSSEVQTCRDQLQEGTISLHIHSVMSAKDCKVEPRDLCAEDVEQARHFYQVMTQDASASDGVADVYARNACSSISFSPSIMTAEERRKRIQAKLKQQKGEQAAPAPASQSGGKAKQQKQPQSSAQKQRPVVQQHTSTPSAAPASASSKQLSSNPAVQSTLSPLAASHAEKPISAAAPNSTGLGNNSSSNPSANAPVPVPAATPAAAPAPKAASVSAVPGGKKGVGGAAGSKGGKQGGLTNLWGKAAKGTASTFKKPAAPIAQPATAPEAPVAASQVAAKAADTAPCTADTATGGDADDAVGSKKRRGQQLVEDGEGDDTPQPEQQQQQQQPHTAKARNRARVVLGMDSDDDDDDSGDGDNAQGGTRPSQLKQKQTDATPEATASTVQPAASTVNAAAVEAVASVQDSSRAIRAEHSQQQKQPPRQQRTHGDCDTSKDQAAAPTGHASGSGKRGQQVKSLDAASTKQPADAEMMSPVVSKPTGRGAEAAATPATELQTPAAAATPTHPPAKRQKTFTTSFGYSGQSNQPRIDPITGEEIWGEEEDKPTPKPGFISTPAVMGGSKAAPVFNGKAADKQKAKLAGAAGDEVAKGASATNKKAAGGTGKKGASSNKAAQKNIMSFFGRS